MNSPLTDESRRQAIWPILSNVVPPAKCRGGSRHRGCRGSERECGSASSLRWSDRPGAFTEAAGVLEQSPSLIFALGQCVFARKNGDGSKILCERRAHRPPPRRTWAGKDRPAGQTIAGPRRFHLKLLGSSLFRHDQVQNPAPLASGAPAIRLAVDAQTFLERAADIAVLRDELSELRSPPVLLGCHCRTEDSGILKGLRGRDKLKW